MRYRRREESGTYQFQTCGVLLGLIAACFFLILIFDAILSNMSGGNAQDGIPANIFDAASQLGSSGAHTLNAKNELIPKANTRDGLQSLDPTQQSMRLQQNFRWHFNQLLSNKLIKKETKTPSDFEVASLLSQVYSDFNQPVNFIQVGACDGEFVSSNDPIQKLLRSDHWNGVMMEPVPYLFGKLKENIQTLPHWQSRIHLLNAALSDRNGIQNFHIVNEKFAKEKPGETHALKHQIGSFDKEHITKHLIKLHRRGELSEEVDAYIKIIGVNAMTPDTVVSEFMKSGLAARDGTIDILLIDAEGYDLTVLQSFMKILEIRPAIIIYENLHLKSEQKSEAERLLQNFGYSIWGAGWNTMGVRVAEL